MLEALVIWIIFVLVTILFISFLRAGRCCHEWEHQRTTRDADFGFLIDYYICAKCKDKKKTY